MLDEPTRDRLLARIGLLGAPAPDADGLRLLHRAFVSRVPYEALAVTLGEYAPLEEAGLVERMLDGGRGGYCFEVNTVLRALLVACGFDVERRLGWVGPRESFRNGDPLNHMVLVVTTRDGDLIADAGLGEGPLDPLPLAVGEHPSGSSTYTVSRDGAGWYVAFNAEHATLPGFRVGGTHADLEAFQADHRRLSTSDESSFVAALVVQRPYDDAIVTLRSRTLFVDGPGVRERRVLDTVDDFAEALCNGFGIELDPDRLTRAWDTARAQHRARTGLVAA